LEDYYIKLWHATYINSANASHTKLFIPNIFHRLPFLSDQTSFSPNS
jgi:hypothetical protein